jgi:tRNA threonylcarbamoyladenosine biosynthesis protein TsaB
MLLAIDTSTRFVGVAVYDGFQVLGEITWASQDYHTVELAPVVVDIMDRAHVLPSALKVVAVATGPGSFTGLRIGLSLAKGMALVHHFDLVGVPTLDILAAAQPMVNLPMAAVLRAGRGRLAVGWYQPGAKEWKATGALEVLAIEALAEKIDSPTLVCGELDQEERRILNRRRGTVILATPARSLRRPSFLAELAWKRWLNGQRDDPAVLAPIYLHQQEPVQG